MEFWLFPAIIHACVLFYWVLYIFDVSYLIIRLTLKRQGKYASENVVWWSRLLQNIA